MMVVLISIALSLFLFSSRGFGARREIRTDRPIIGIMAQATKRMTFEGLGKNYIPASYVKFLESSGARVVPIFNDLTENETKEIFKSINGAVFPGGIVNLFTSGYANVSRRIFQLAKKRNDDGGYFPIMGMCLGHQILAAVVNNNTDNRILTDSYNMTAPLNLPKNFRDSKLFRDIPKDRVEAFNATLITPHFHNLSLPVRLFQESEELKDFYKVLTTNIDRHGVEFVSTMEAKNYPFYSMQWHPEKCPFEWVSMKAIPHFLPSIQLSQYISNFFVEEAKLSQNRFPSDEAERVALIYNYNPVYLGRDGNTVFSQVYLFN